jgi:tetratricopeptide (TPR) repeat protein
VSFTARVLAALLHARGGRWEDVIRILAPALRSHLNPIGFSDESMWALARWLVADAYARLGELDSAAANLEITVDPAGALRDGEDLEARGLISSFAHQRLVLLYARLGRVAEAQRHWKAFREAFTRPDPELVPLINEARQALLKTEGVRQ